MVIDIPDEFLRRTCGASPEETPSRAVAAWLYGTPDPEKWRQRILTEQLGKYALHKILTAD